MVALSSCNGEHEKPGFVYMPDMAYGPGFKSGEIGVMKPPVPGTIARGQKVYPFPTDAERAGRELRNPLPIDEKTLKMGQERFEIYCTVCHGRLGDGDGPIVPKFPKPPTLHSDKIRNWSDGRLFHVMTVGQNIMPSYASQVDPEERWAIAHYIRVLQRAKNPKDSDYGKLNEVGEE